MNKYFRTKTDKQLEKHLSQFEYWDEIQPVTVDLAFEAYLKGSCATHLSSLVHSLSREIGMIFTLIEKGGLLGVAAEAHEKWEVLEYLKKGYSLEDIDNGKSFKEHRIYAHMESRFKECRLYQFLYEKEFGKKAPPIYAFLLVCPFLEVFIERLYKSEITNNYLETLTEEIGIHRSSTVSLENCSKKDLENALKFFERSGYEYDDSLKILRKAEDFIKRHT